MPRIQPLSVFIGLALALVCTLTMSQGTMTAQQAGVRIDYGPQPRDMRQVIEGTPFVVPPGKVFVVTALGTSDPSNSQFVTASLFVNGQEALVSPKSFAVQPSMMTVPTGLSVQAGSVVSVVDSLPHPAIVAQAWGYLADVQPSVGASHQAIPVEYMPSARDLIQIKGGTPFTVPSGKVFVLTTLARISDASAGVIVLKLNGQVVCTAPNTNGTTGAAFHAMPLGFTAPQGSTLTVEPTYEHFQAWGYLADQ